MPGGSAAFDSTREIINRAVRLRPRYSPSFITDKGARRKGPGGRRMDGDYAVTEAEPSKLIKFQVIAGPARPSGTYKLEAAGNATRVTFVLDYQTKGLARLMDGMIGKTMQSEVGTLSNLKAYLESHPA